MIFKCFFFLFFTGVSFYKHSLCSFLGNYGNQIDGVSKPVKATKKSRGDDNDEETELIHNSSDEEPEEDGDLVSISLTPPMKPVITDRSVRITDRIQRV